MSDPHGMQRELRQLRETLRAEGLSPGHAERLQRLGIGPGELRRRLRQGEGIDEIAQENPWSNVDTYVLGGLLVSGAVAVIAFAVTQRVNPSFTSAPSNG